MQIDSNRSIGISFPGFADTADFSGYRIAKRKPPDSCAVFNCDSVTFLLQSQ
jgi:hypothetical protein